MDCYGGINNYGDYRHSAIIGSNNAAAAYHSHHIPNYSPSHLHNYHSYNYHQSPKMHQIQAPNFRNIESDSSILACDRFGYGSNVNGMAYNNNYGNASHSYVGPMDSRSYSQHQYPPPYDSYNAIPAITPPTATNYSPSIQPQPSHTQFPYSSRDYHSYDNSTYKTRTGAENYMSRDTSYHHQHHNHQPNPSASSYMNNYYGSHANSMNPNDSGNEHYLSSMPYRSMHPSSNNFTNEYHKNLPLMSQYANDGNVFAANIDSGIQKFICNCKMLNNFIMLCTL